MLHSKEEQSCKTSPGRARDRDVTCLREDKIDPHQLARADVKHSQW